jgi:hypothetical protein
MDAAGSKHARQSVANFLVAGVIGAIGLGVISYLLQGRPGSLAIPLGVSFLAGVLAGLVTTGFAGYIGVVVGYAGAAIAFIGAQLYPYLGQLADLEEVLSAEDLAWMAFLLVLMGVWAAVAVGGV